MVAVTLDCEPTPPAWALDCGLPAPEDGEGFRAYYVRLGIEEFVVSSCFAGLDVRTQELANARMGTVLAQRTPQQYKRYLARRLSAYRRA